MTAVIGRNGSGKSSLLGLLSGQDRPSRGSVHISGQPIEDLSHRELARRRAVLTQDTRVAFGFTVREVVSWGRHPWRGSPESARDDEIVDESLALQDIGHLAHRRVTELSGGERKRVHIARVLAQRAPLLLLDEADSDLDLVGRAVVDDLVRNHVRSGGTAVVVTHDASRISAVCDDVVLMSRGSVLAHGPRQKVLVPSLLTEAFEQPVTVTSDGEFTAIRLI